MTFGKVWRGDSGFWLIRCEPHVRARLKRVFARAPQQAGDIVRISDTPENSRDLEWFLQRYPMEVANPQELRTSAWAHREMEGRLAALLSLARSPAPFHLALPPREYQEIAAHALDIRSGLLLSDDVGLGKTVSAICAMTDTANLPALVVCPAHMPRQWQEQLTKFAPNLRAHIISSSTPYSLTADGRRRRDLYPDRLPDVLITSYHKLRGWADTLAGVVRYVVFDECQQLRHPGSLIYTACEYVASKARRRLGLSATPIYNYGSEFFWVVDALLPGVLGTREEFVREWCVAAPGDKARINDTAEFGAWLRREGVMLRRTRAEVGRELPPLTRAVHTVSCDHKVIDSLASDAAHLARIILAHNEQFRGQKMNAAGEFDNLMRQATGVAKAPYVAEFVRLLLENGEPVVLFGWHREVYRIWLERLREFNPVMYTGSESPKQKDEAKAKFVGGETPLLIMSLRSGAGLDGIQERARTCVFGELDWSPGTHVQCMGRLHRDGQSDPVMAYYLVAEDGADPIMAEVLGIKREQIEGVINPDSALIERIETGTPHIQRLARELLEKRGETTVDEGAREI